MQQASLLYVQHTQNLLTEIGFKAQAFPREINFFYLKKGLRERIVFENNIYKVLNTNIEFTEKEMLDEIDNHPEHFSPNVIMRPLFQESILPNLAYIGGGGELAYWMERKSQFQHFGVFFPMLIRRNSVLWLDKNTSNRIEKLGLSTLDLFGNTDVVIKQFLHQNAGVELTLQQEKSEIIAIFERIKLLAFKIDPTLEGTVAAESIKQSNVIDQLESRLLRAEKQKNEVNLNQIKALLQKAAPGGGLQERFENFLPYYIKHGAAFFDILLENLTPLENGFEVLMEE
jgi:bacillithiol biosynthesis cysteine-adding enzyme BshC